MASKIPQDLLDYLHTMIIPDGGECLILLDGFDTTDFSTYADNHFHGIIARGTPTLGQSEQMERILRPGGHCLLIAPDEQPAGYDGACNLEDSGFEIRDSIAWIRHADNDFCYTSKASGAERNAGLGSEETWVYHREANLTEEDEALIRECLELEEDAEIPESINEKELPSEIASLYPSRRWEMTARRCTHPTVKAVKIMEFLLQDVPVDQGPVLDPFMGSGTTGIACLKTGHDFIGVEREEEYIGIADARIRHWDHVEHPFGGTEIKSDAKQEVKEEREISIDDLFGV